MRRPLAVLLTSFAVFSSSSLARQDKPQSPESVAPAATDSLAITLLRESHDLDPQLPLRVRVSSLGAQAQMASRLTADLGREWANELFTLSFQTEGRERSYAQDTAATILARVDPDRALELLHSMSTDEPEPNRTDWLPHRQLVDQVFQILVARDGVRALPALEQEAERLGIAWHYPYAALAQAAMQTVSKEWGNNNQHAVEVVQSVFEKESQNYSQDPRREYFDDVEFGKMLRIVSGGLPPESTQPALRALVKNLIATDLKKYRFQSELYTKDGEVASADNAIDAAILNLGDVINRVDPELAKELQTTRPELRVGLDYARDERPRLWAFGPSPANKRPADPNAKTRMDVIRLSHINPDAAIAKAEGLPSGVDRSLAILQVAHDIAGDDPERAAKLIAEAQPADQPPNASLQLELISARANVAAAEQKKEELRELLESGFDSANRAIVDKKAQFAGLGALVQLGIQNEPELTVSFLENLPPSAVKANLLMGAVAALNMKGRLPLSSRPRPNQENAAKQ